MSPEQILDIIQGILIAGLAFICVSLQRHINRTNEQVREIINSNIKRGDLLARFMDRSIDWMWAHEKIRDNLIDSAKANTEALIAINDALNKSTQNDFTEN
jgi:capsid protein